MDDDLCESCGCVLFDGDNTYCESCDPDRCCECGEPLEYCECE